jgi:TetR/AcrR family transcriptional regulator
LGLPKPVSRHVKDVLLERLPRTLTGLAYSFFFISGGRIGPPLFNEMLEEVIHRREAIKAPEDNFPEYVVGHFIETYEENEDWIKFLIREALDDAGKCEALKDERENLIRKFVEDIKRRQEEGFIDKTLDPEYLMLLIFSVSFFPRVFANATKTTTGLDPSDPEFEKRWSEFLRDVAKRIQAESSQGKS